MAHWMNLIARLLLLLLRLLTSVRTKPVGIWSLELCTFFSLPPKTDLYPSPLLHFLRAKLGFHKNALMKIDIATDGYIWGFSANCWESSLKEQGQVYNKIYKIFFFFNLFFLFLACLKIGCLRKNFRHPSDAAARSEEDTKKIISR